MFITFFTFEFNFYVYKTFDNFGEKCMQLFHFFSATKSCRLWSSDSGVARVPCALGQEIFLRPPSTKPAEFEVKIKYKSAEEAKAKHLLGVILLFFEGNETHLMLETNSTKL